MASVALVAGCGGASGSSRIDEPLVRNFSPHLSPILFTSGNGSQTPTFTDNALTVSTDPAYPGKVVIFFQDSTELAPSSVFLGGSSTLGLDPSSLQFTQEIPGMGNVLVPVHVTVEKDRVILQPQGPTYATGTGPNAITNLPAGQYTVGVFNNVKSTKGDGLLQGPVFHTFTVGNADTIAPRVLTSSPGRGEKDVGFSVPPPQGPPGFEDTVADITTSIFGPTTPDVIIRFTEGIRTASVNAQNIKVNQVIPLVGEAMVPPEAGFPRLKSLVDGQTLPSNGHEVVWRAAVSGGGFRPGTQVIVRVVGSDGGMNPSPIQDLAGNDLETTQEIQFQTAAPPSLPQNPFPEYAIWWSGSDRVGTIDPVNQQDRGDVFLGVESYPLGIPANVVPEFTDTVATEQNIPNFDPFEIVLDTRTNASTCHSWAYVQSFESGQVAIINTRTSVPVAMINTPSPGGITCSSGGGGPGVLVVTNSSVNTYTVFSIGGLTPGTSFLNGPLNIAARRNTGNNPRAVSISHPPGGDYRRGATGFPLLGPGTEVLMYADFSDGVVNTTTLARETPAKQFALGPQSAPNDLSFTSCNVLTGIMFAAISQGGSGPGQGKVAAYVAGPGCLTGVSTAGIPDEIVGDLSGLDGPSGLTFMSQNTSRATWAVAESGGDAVKTIGFAVGTVSPEIVLSHTVGVGDNPTAVTVRSAWLNPCIATQGTDGCTHGPVAERDCWYNGTEQDIVNFGLVGGTAGTNLYVCARGSGFVSVIEEGTGFTLDDPVMIPGIRFVATTMRQ